MLIPRNNLKGIDVTRFKIKLHEVAKVDEAFRALFG
jgi:DNA repair protein RadA/Sms